MAAGIGGIGANEVVKGITAPKDIAVVIGNHIFVMHPALGLPGKEQVDFVINLNLYIGMAGKRVKIAVPLHAHQPGKTVNQNLYLYPLVCFMEHDRHDIPGAFTVPEIKCGQYDPFLCQAHEAHPLIPCVLIGLQDHGPVTARSILIKGGSRSIGFRYPGNRFIMVKGCGRTDDQIQEYK